MEKSTIVEFEVILMLKLTDGTRRTYHCPLCKSTGKDGLGPTLLKLVIARKLHRWIEEALKEK